MMETYSISSGSAQPYDGYQVHTACLLQGGLLCMSAMEVCKIFTQKLYR